MATFRLDHLPPDLRNLAPMRDVLARLDPILSRPIHLGPDELEDLLAFVGDGLLDPDARRDTMRALLPATVPSGLPLPRFE